MIFRNPQLLALLLLLPAIILIWRWRGMRVSFAALLLRLLTVGLVALALADPALGSQTPPPGALVILVDQSDSLTAEGQATLRTVAEQLAETARESGVGAVATLWFGANVIAENTDGEALDPAGSDLARALRTARELLPASDGQIIVLSDGLATTDDALLEARRIAEYGRIDVWPIAPATGAEVGIVAVETPRTLWLNQEYTVRIAVHYQARPGDDPVNAILRLREGEHLLAEQDVILDPGVNHFTFDHRATLAGVVQLSADIEAAADTFAQNNRAAATATVTPPPRILLVEGRGNGAIELDLALRRSGIETQTIFASQLPVRLTALDAFDGMVLVDVPASSLSLDQLASVREFVRGEGRGLVVIGGRNSFGLGAYKDSPLEEVLPVSMDPPPRPQRSDVALLLIIDRSASMTAAIDVSKFDMAKEAAILATESLQSEDRIGILAFDTGQLWVVPFQNIGDGLGLEQIQDSVARLPSGGGTDIFAALDLGLAELAIQPSSVRHAVLLTDGRSFTNNRSAYQRLVEDARAQNITLSTIAIGQDADMQLLDALAQWGGGRYYFAGSPEDLPRLTLLESEIARADPIVEEDFRALLAEAHPLLRNFAPADLPQLEGYVATTPKDGAETVLRSPADDPVLAVWQYGLGRAVAWTPSVGEPWADTWAFWLDYDRFWAQVVRYTLPDPESGPLQVRMAPQADGARLIVDAIQPGGEPLDLALVNARITLPDGTIRDFNISQTAPGRYTQDLRLPAAGPYAVSVVLMRDGERQQADTGYTQPVPAEYRLALTNNVSEQGRALLEQIAAATGGQVLTDEINLTNDAVGLASTVHDEPFALWPWLLGTALVAWVLEIATRRGVFVRRQKWTAYERGN